MDNEAESKQFGIPKTQEKLQSQIEFFADRGVERFSKEQEGLLKYSSILAQIRDYNNLPDSIPPEAKELFLKHKDEYIKFFRSERRLETTFKEENIKNYNEKFKPAIDVLKERMKIGNPRLLPEYLGSGSNGSAFSVEVEGKKYAVKFSRNLVQSNFEIKPLIRAMGFQSNVAQLAAYSFEDGVVIMEQLPGKEITKFDKTNPIEYTDDQVIALIKTVVELDKRGIIIDPKASNFLYDREKGFSVLDYQLRGEDSEYSLGRHVFSLLVPLAHYKSPNLDYRDPDYEEKADKYDREKYMYKLPIIVRFLEIVKSNYPEIFEQIKEENKFGDIIDENYLDKTPEVSLQFNKLKEYLPG